MADRTTREKWRAYPNTILTFAPPHALRVDLRQPLPDEARRELAAAGWANAFAVFTAENPSGENTEDAPTEGNEAARDRENRERRGSLRDELRRRGLRMRDVDGSAPDGSYTEHCVAVDAPLEEAVGLARDWDQLALFWYDGSVFWLVAAEAGQAPVALPGVAAAR